MKAKYLAFLAVLYTIFLAIIAYFRIATEWVNLFSTITGTGLAAWAGGAAAFGVQRERDKEVERALHVASANQTLATLNMMANIFAQYQLEYAGNMKDDPLATLHLSTPVDGTMLPLHFDFEGIRFLLNNGKDVCVHAFLDLHNLDWQYQNLISVIMIRNQALKDLELAIHAKQIGNLKEEDVPVFFSYQFNRLEIATRNYVEVVEHGSKLSRAVLLKTMEALQIIYPKERFLFFNQT